jgi:pullulanase
MSRLKFQKHWELLWSLLCGSLLLAPASLSAQAAPLPSKAHWLNATTLAWQAPSAQQYQLCHDKTAQMYQEQGKHRGGTCLPLQAQGLLKQNPELLKRYPHLSHYPLYRLPTLKANQLETLLQSQLWAVALDAQDKVKEQTGIQNFGLLESEKAYTGSDLGLSFSAGKPHFRLWAPTAQEVALELYSPQALQKPNQILNMQKSEAGTWALEGQANWLGHYYRYRVKAYRYDTGRIETHSVTDPYSVSLAADSSHSQIIDLSDPSLKPQGWETLQLPRLEVPEDSVIYELHLRDFSISDPTVPVALRGKYGAFSQLNSNGMKHLSQLAESGLTHIHLLPVFDIATIPERYALEAKIPQAAPDSPRQQDALALVRDKDGFNWGYDPLHYGVPEGSYASDPQGAARILEFRQMVQSLAQHQLRAVMDVVYNHTHSAGPGAKSVLDKIVPGYYYRLDGTGQIQQSTCCPDTATEHLMMEKLMRETLLRWAKAYKVAGFRFDLMGHHSRENFKHIRADLDHLTLEKDGIDGKSILLYGEGWKFGSLDAILPDQAMNQVAGAGLGVGMFNDRMRDSARGGNYDHSTRSDQGFATGLFTDPNQSPFNKDTPQESEAQKALLLNYSDNLRVALAGGLKDYRLQNAQGQNLSGGEIHYRGQPGSGFSQDPQETINYVSAHDNYSLWDQIAAKAPFELAERSPSTATAEERMQMQALALSLPLLGQGIPFIHAGSELLRSKSGDGDSYDSGDWFNLIDWTGAQHGWGRGLPPAWRNAQEWDFWKPRLSHPELKPSQTLAQAHLARIHELLRMRKSSPLFRLQSAQEIAQRVHFYNTGPGQIPGLIAMEIKDNLPGLSNLDPERRAILVFWNATLKQQRFCQSDWAQRKWEVYTLSGMVTGKQVEQADSDCLTVPSRSSLVYHERENQAL